ncbi:MAG TPA: hypothetical protein VJ816_06015 [Gemmatimonadales bacterium]|nr:hypothetical protein [Gemmatimonadales bacterium]
MEGEEQGAAVETASPTVSDPAVDPSSQATTPPAQPQEQQVPFHQHPRFQELIRDRQVSRQTIAQMQQQLEQQQAKFAELERKQNQGRTSPEEDEQLRQAGTALERIIMSNPEMLDRLLSAHPQFKAWKENADKLLATTGQTQQLQQAQSQALMRQATSHIHGLAKEAGLPQTPEYLQRLVRLVAAEAQAIEGGNQRFSQGDLSVLDEGFKALQGNFLNHTQRAGTAGLLQTKSRTQSLPPAPRGGAAGPPGLPKFDPKTMTVQDRMNDFRKASAAILAEGSKE